MSSSAHTLFVQDVAVTLNEAGTEAILDITGEALARRYCRRRNVGDGMPKEINDSHNAIIQVAHSLNTHRDWMPVTFVYFNEAMYELGLPDDNDIIRALPLGYSKPCFGFRMAREVDPFYKRWVSHYHKVRSGVERVADKKTIRGIDNKALTQVAGTKMIMDARREGANGTEYPLFFHFHKDNDPAVKCIWAEPKPPLWQGKGNDLSIIYRLMDRVRINVSMFEHEFAYMVNQKYKGIDPAVTIRIVKQEYGRLIYALYQKEPSRTVLSKDEVFLAAKEVDIDGVIYNAMAQHRKPPTNLLGEE